MGIVFREKIQERSGGAVIIQYIRVWYVPYWTCKHQNVNIEQINHNNGDILQFGTKYLYRAYWTHVS
jgi:hypothetical protein